MNGFTGTGIATTCEACGDNWILPAAPGTHACRRNRGGATAPARQGGGHLYTAGVENPMFSALAESQPVCVSCGARAADGKTCPDRRPLRARLARHAPHLVERYDAAVSAKANTAHGGTAHRGTTHGGTTHGGTAHGGTGHGGMSHGGMSRGGTSHSETSHGAARGQQPARRTTTRNRDTRPAPPPLAPSAPSNGTFRRRSIFLTQDTDDG
jgi:hypothetical protein